MIYTGAYIELHALVTCTRDEIPILPNPLRRWNSYLGESFMNRVKGILAKASRPGLSKPFGAMGATALYCSLRATRGSLWRMTVTHDRCYHPDKTILRV